MYNKKIVISVIVSLVIGSCSFLMLTLSEKRKSVHLHKIIALQDSMACIQSKVDEKREIIYQLHTSLDSVEGVVRDVLRSIHTMDDSLRNLSNSLYQIRNSIMEGQSIQGISQSIESLDQEFHKLELEETELQKQVIQTLARHALQAAEHQDQIKNENRKLKATVVDLGSDLWDTADNLRMIQSSKSTPSEQQINLQNKIKSQQAQIDKLVRQLNDLKQIKDSRDTLIFAQRNYKTN